MRHMPQGLSVTNNLPGGSERTPLFNPRQRPGSAEGRPLQAGWPGNGAERPNEVHSSPISHCRGPSGDSGHRALVVGHHAPRPDVAAPTTSHFHRRGAPLSTRPTTVGVNPETLLYRVLGTGVFRNATPQYHP